MILQDTGGTGNGRRGEEDVVSVTISWVKKAVVQETPAEADFPSQEHCGMFFALHLLLFSAPELITPLP